MLATIGVSIDASIRDGAISPEVVGVTIDVRDGAIVTEVVGLRY